jgi:hypothetical protein
VAPLGVLTVSKSVTAPLVIVTLGEDKLAVGPFFDNGLTLVEKLTVPANPLNVSIVMVEFALFPRLIVRLVEDEVSEKSGIAMLLKVADWAVSGAGEDVPFAIRTQSEVLDTLLWLQPVW